MTRARIYVAIAVLTAFLAVSVIAGYIEPRLSNTPATLAQQPQVVAGVLLSRGSMYPAKTDPARNAVSTASAT